jgi:microcystin-dependent protein
MAPSQVNDSARGGMASVAKYRDDISGVLATSGTSTAYTVTSNQGFASLAALAGKVVAFTPHATNGASPTLNVDGLGDKPLRGATGAALGSNVLLAGTPYVALYSNANSEFVLQGMTANPYGIPLAAGMDYWADTTPGSAYAFPTGQAISRTTYAKLFDLVGTKFGTGDGSTTFNLPDKTGRISAMKEAAATRLTSSYFGGDSTALGAVGGTESHTLSLTQIPSHDHGGNTGAGTPHSHGGVPNTSSTNIGSGEPAFINLAASGNGTHSTDAESSHTHAITAAGGGGAHANVQPTIVCNYIMRII